MKHLEPNKKILAKKRLLNKKRLPKVKIRYLRLAEILAKQIASGNYPVGSKLPTEHELSYEHNLSRHTVRESLRQLKEQGLVERRQGSGSVVIAQQPVTQMYVHAIRSLQDVAQHAQEARLSLHAIGTVAVKGWQCDKLDCKPGKRWLRIQGTRIVENQSSPISWTEIYVDGRFKRIQRFVKNSPLSISALVQEKCGAPIHCLDQKIESISIPKEICEHLNALPGSPGLLITRNYKDKNSQTIIFSTSIHPGDRYAYSMKIVRK